MRRYFYLLSIVALAAVGCAPTRIVTYSPANEHVYTYSTSVTVPRTRTTTTTTRVVAADDDISLYLDLQAVGAAFAQSETVQEFEDLINNSSYILNNLDLNGDGYVDYLRVLETVEGYAHVFLIQAVLGQNVYQDVATLVAEVNSLTNYHVQVIGSPYIYGPNFIVQPVFYTRPAIFVHLHVRNYRPWFSPWHWDHFPPHYRHPKPIFVNHYQAYVRTYMTNHRYCHEVRYVAEFHFRDYERVSRNFSRNDYQRQYPERTFTERTANIARSAQPGQPAGKITNARDIIERQAASTKTSVTTGRATNTEARARSMSTAESTGTRSTSATAASRSAGTATTSRSAATATTSRSAGTSSATATRSSSTSSASRANETTVKSRVSSSGSSDTKIRTVTPSGTESTRNRETSTPTRSSSTSSSVSRSATSSSSATRSSSTGTSARSASTSTSARSSSTGTSTRSSSTGTAARSATGATSRSASAGTGGNRR